MNEVKVQSAEQIETQEAIAQLKAERERLQEQVKALEALTKAVSFKLTEFKHKKTGENQVGINVHGITAKPMFFYGSQALKMVEVTEKLKEFVEANRAALSWKK